MSRPCQPFCGRGHAMSGENLIITRTGKRRCRACRKMGAVKYRELSLVRRGEMGPELPEAPVIVRAEYRVVRDPWAEAIFGQR